MTTAPSTLIALQKKLVENLGTVNLGIVGDAAHIRSGGYHIGAATLRNNGMGGDYSLRYDEDKVTHDYACAIDIGGSQELLMKLGNRIANALMNHDLRVYRRIRGTNAPFGKILIDRRVDDENPDTASDDHIETTDDRNHIHVEVYRSLVLNQNVMDGLYAVLAGSTTTPTGGMKMDEDVKKAFADLRSHIDDQFRQVIKGDPTHPNSLETVNNRLQTTNTRLDEIEAFLSPPAQPL